MPFRGTPYVHSANRTKTKLHVTAILLCAVNDDYEWETGKNGYN
jgi:hypothetical protein